MATNPMESPGCYAVLAGILRNQSSIIEFLDFHVCVKHIDCISIHIFDYRFNLVDTFFYNICLRITLSPPIVSSNFVCYNWKVSL